MTRYLLLLVVACGSPAAKPIANVAEPGWPAGDTVSLTWVVSPATIPHPKWPDTFLAPVELEVSIGDVTRRMKLEPQQGSLFPHNQVVCRTTAYPLEAGEVAKITFDETGAGGYFVRRRQPEQLEVGSWAQSDTGRGEQAVSSLTIPAGVKVREAIVQVSPSGERTPLECPPPSP